MKVTVVIPVYNEHETLRPLAAQVREQLRDTPHRILFVDDGSSDASWEVLSALHTECPDVDALRFAANSGKTLALAAGFSRADGDAIITMDADLQDDPAEIPRFLAALETGYDLVNGWKVTRHDPWTKRFPSRVYNRGISLLFGLHLHDVNCGFKAMRVDVAKRLPLRGDMHRLIPVLAARNGARVTEMGVQHHPRRWGSSKYGFERFWEGIRDALCVVLAGKQQDTRLPETAHLVAEQLIH